MKISGKLLKMLIIFIFFIVLLYNASSVYGFKEKTSGNALESKEFRNNNLAISQSGVPLDQIIDALPNKNIWLTFLKNYSFLSSSGYAYIDPRSGRPSSLTYTFPLIPGTGTNNNSTLESLYNDLGYRVTKITDNEIRILTLKFLHEHASLLTINTEEIQEVRTGNPADYLWQVFITRQLKGIPIRDSHISLTINHGNIVLWGLEKWGDVHINIEPFSTQEQALQIVYDFIDNGSSLKIDIINRPHLEIIPVAPSWDGTIGQGYDHVLAWVFIFQIEGYPNTWEMLIDAHNNKIISFQDLNKYVAKKITGAVYPVSNDECCPDGCAVDPTPMPFADTGFITPNDFTNLGGFYDYTSGTALTTLSGKYIMINDNCGIISENSKKGDIDMKGANGQHDCQKPGGHSDGDTFAARTGFAELTTVNRIARNWLNYAWIESRPTANINIAGSCNSYWNGTTINFYRSGTGCGNTGEIAAILDHEWAHGLDDNDINGTVSNPGEAFADMLANLRLHNSCIGRGYDLTINNGCGQWTCPGSGSLVGYNCSGYGDCCINCTGVREHDYLKHASGIPHTPANFVCTMCSAGSGPCARDTYCESAPVAEASWDLAARDLQSPPFTYDKQTAFEVTAKLAYTGSGNVTDWFTCNCIAGTSDGCGTNNGYMQWIAADDDDGNINNGTPHMSAIYAAFNRHAIACPVPAPLNSGCSNGPSAAPVLSVTPSNNKIYLSWTPVAGADKYYVLRTQGFSCDTGKIKIATVTGISYVDTQALNNITYYYSIMPVGTNPACLGLLSNCVAAVPVPCSSCAQYRTASAAITASTGGDNDAYVDNCETATVQLIIENIGTGIAQSTTATINSADPFVAITTPMPIIVGDIPLDGSVNIIFNFDLGKAMNKAACMQKGTFTISVQASGQSPAAQNSFSFIYEKDYASGSRLYAFEPATGLEGWTVEEGTWALSSARTNPVSSTRSVHSSEYLNNQCDVILSPELEATATTNLVIPNWYSIEPQGGGYWYDRANTHIIETATMNRTLVYPTWRMYQTGTFYNWGAFCSIGIERGWSGDFTGNFWDTSFFDLSSFAGQIIQIEIRYMTDGASNREGVYIDDILVNNVIYQGCDAQSDICAVSNPPGTVPDNDNFPGVPLTMIKSGANLILNWGAPGGSCITSDYGIYRGTLPWIGYNHSSVLCSTSGNTNATITADSGSYYYLVVAQNSGEEGSYGFNSNNTQRPTALSPCLPQNIGTCN